jgi:hypothetical protein
MKHRAHRKTCCQAADKAEPSPVTALRDMFAECFASEVAAVAPLVCEILEDQYARSADPEERKIVRRAIDLLSGGALKLSCEIARNVRRHFDTKLAPPPDSLTRTWRFNLDSLTLMEEKHLQEGIALNVCVTRLKEQSDAELFALTERVRELLGCEHLPEAENPVFPRILGRALLDVLGGSGCDEATKLAIFRAFGPMLLNIAPDIYAQANTMLAERGILAEFKTARFGAPVLRPSRPAAQKTHSIDAPALAELRDRLLSGSGVLAASHARQAIAQTLGNAALVL